MPLSIQPIDLSLPSYATTDTAAVHATLNGLDGTYLNRDLYARYLSACEELHVSPMSAVRFFRTVAALGHTSWRRNTARGWTILGN